MWSGVFVVALLCGIGSSITVHDCPDTMPRDEYLQVFQDKCYYFYLDIGRKFPGAQEICQQDGGYLASVKTQKVNDFIWTELRKTYNFYGVVWIGLSDADIEGVYEWRDGTGMDFENFEYGAGPNTGIFDISYGYQDCVVLRSSGGKWSDYKCSGFFSFSPSFVCEYPSKPTKKTNPSAATATTTTATSTFPATPRDPGSTSSVTKSHTTTVDSVSTNTRRVSATATATTVGPTPTSQAHTGPRNDASTFPTVPVSTKKNVPDIDVTNPSSATSNPTTVKQTTAPTQTSAPETTPKATTMDAQSTRHDSTSDADVTVTKKATTPAPTCPSIVCDLDCGLDGYQTDSKGCVVCKCDER